MPILYSTDGSLNTCKHRCVLIVPSLSLSILYSIYINNYSWYFLKFKMKCSLNIWLSNVSAPCLVSPISRLPSQRHLHIHDIIQSELFGCSANSTLLYDLFLYKKTLNVFCISDNVCAFQLDEHRKRDRARHGNFKAVW